jgi:hypothetical protein
VRRRVGGVREGCMGTGVGSDISLSALNRGCYQLQERKVIVMTHSVIFCCLISLPLLVSLSLPFSFPHTNTPSLLLVSLSSCLSLSYSYLSLSLLLLLSLSLSYLAFLYIHVEQQLVVERTLIRTHFIAPSQSQTFLLK